MRIWLTSTLSHERRPDLDRLWIFTCVSCWTKPEHMDDVVLATGHTKELASLEQEDVDSKEDGHQADVLASINPKIILSAAWPRGYPELRNPEKSLKEIIRTLKDKGEEQNRFNLLQSVNDKTIDDNERPSAGSDQGKSSKRRRHNLGASALTSTGWQITDTRDVGADSSMHISDPESEHSEQSSDDIPMQDEGNDSDIEDTDNAHIPKVSTTTWFKPIPESERPATPEPEGPFPRGPPGQVTIQPQFFFNKDLDYLLTENTDMTSDAVMAHTTGGLEEKEFYINKHSEPSDREAVRSQMRILSVISVKKRISKTFIHGFLKNLFLLNIQKKAQHLPKTDKTSLHTSVNIWIRNLVIRNRVGDLQLEIESYQTKINLECPNWDEADYYFKEDYTIVLKPRAVVYREE
ncbi:hypothetical protein Tco_0478742 [Tanacetum coccineum]